MTIDSNKSIEGGSMHIESVFKSASNIVEFETVVNKVKEEISFFGYRYIYIPGSS